MSIHTRPGSTDQLRPSQILSQSVKTLNHSQAVIGSRPATHTGTQGTHSYYIATYGVGRPVGRSLLAHTPEDRTWPVHLGPESPLVSGFPRVVLLFCIWRWNGCRSRMLLSFVLSFLSGRVRSWKERTNEGGGGGAERTFWTYTSNMHDICRPKLGTGSPTLAHVEVSVWRERGGGGWRPRVRLWHRAGPLSRGAQNQDEAAPWVHPGSHAATDVRLRFRLVQGRIWTLTLTWGRGHVTISVSFILGE